MDQKIIFLTLGIRHRRSFGIIDRVGQILDFALYDTNSPFNTDTFPNMFEKQNGGRILANPDTNESFAVDADNVVLRLKVKNFHQAYEALKKKYLPFIKNDIFQTFEIENINRIGIVFEHFFDTVPTLESAIKHLTLNEVESLPDIQLRYSKKIASPKAEYQKNIIDYYNAISTFQKEEEGYLATLDYQAYFSPEIASIADVPFEDFFSLAANYLHDKFQSSLTHEEKIKAD